MQMNVQRDVINTPPPPPTTPPLSQPNIESFVCAQVSEICVRGNMHCLKKNVIDVCAAERTLSAQVR